MKSRLKRLEKFGSSNQHPAAPRSREKSMTRFIIFDVNGLDTHDVGGEPNYSDPDPFLSYLRLRKPLAAGMVITNEPGIYFNDFLIKNFLEKHPERLEVVDVTVMEKYKYIGGVRIEDDVLVTKDGYENLTGITSDPDEIEQIVSNGIAKGRSHFHNIA
ncbi:putative peptidase [Hanseniaspora osmophila]|uniref:Putative peptidase n=1 Tax=Hanseniaspora osmophila TaxID=56408 RepID=A0A1E5REH0_9ASCO|nr:putative peptidase [Hanseniaspora osmophila]